MARVRYSAVSHIPGAQVLVPYGLQTPYGQCVSVAEKDYRLIQEPYTGQTAALLDVSSDHVTLEFTFDQTAHYYPDIMFKPKPSKFSLFADELVSEIQTIRGDLMGYALIKRIACHVAERFTYGHPEVTFTQGQDIIPAIGCGMVQGSCVDINTYFMAALRSVNIDAGYVTGFFFPQEKGNTCEDGHCWVVTRVDNETLEWDIAHHLKLGSRDIDAGLNPKPGRRFACFHSMGLDFPELDITGLKALIEPILIHDGQISHFEAPQIEFFEP